jgi:ribosomal-protein-serine acetyltransferase
MFTYIIDESVDLRLLDMNHAEELFQAINKSRLYLREWLPWVDGCQQVKHVQSFILDAKKQYCSNNGFQVGIWYHGQLVGVVGQHKIDWNHKKTSLGYWLAQTYQGKGLMTKACNAIIDYSFCELKLHRVEITCALENTKSRAIPQRLGFQQEGVLREVEWLNNRYVDHVLYGLLSRERVD